LFVFSCTVLFVSISQVIGCEDRLRNDLYCVKWGVEVYSNQPTPGSVLAPTYATDLPVARSCRFIYTNDICCALQAETFSEIECPLTVCLFVCP